MKKTQQILATIISLIILNFFVVSVHAQVWEGNYTIMDSDDVAVLSGHTEVTGFLTIGSTSSGATPTTLESLEGLESLTSVGGDLVVGYNPVLTSLSGLESLTSVGGYLRIISNPTLTSLSGLSNLTSVTINLEMNNNSALTSLSGLESLTSVNSLVVENNPALTSLSDLENLTNIHRSLRIISNATLTSLSGLESLTRVPYVLTVANNLTLTSLSGLENITSIGHSLYIDNNTILTNLCALYNVIYLRANLYIRDNNLLSRDTAYALEAQLRENGFTGLAVIRDNNGSVQVCCDDMDCDTVPDGTDNCPDTANPNQEDADNDTIGDACDPDTIYGTISGAVQGGVSIDIDVYSCGTATTVATVTTNDEGYYAVGGLGTDSYGIVPQYANYVFSPKTQILRVPQTSIRSYDFTAGEPTCESVDRFLDNGDGTVTDCRTDLVWLKNANCYGTQNWNNAMSSAAGLNSGECGLSDESVEGDWRLPTIEELQGIGTDPPTTWPIFYPSDYGITWTTPGSPFVSIDLSPYWSSTEGYLSDYMWYLYMWLGEAYFIYKSTSSLYVWPVRDPN